MCRSSRIRSLAAHHHHAGDLAALLQIGLLARITRSDMLEVLRQTMCGRRGRRAAQLSRRRQHALANAMVPIVTSSASSSAS